MGEPTENMSLTSNIKTNKEMKEFLIRTMPKRETFSSNTAYPPFSKKNPLLVDRYKAEKVAENQSVDKR